MLIQVEDYMLPCLNKKLFGVDCLGCGIQRSLMLIMRGKFIEAFTMYPAIYSLLLLAFIIVSNFFYKFKYAQKIILTLTILNILLIVGNYIYKSI